MVNIQKTLYFSGICPKTWYYHGKYFNNKIFKLYVSENIVILFVQKHGISMDNFQKHGITMVNI